ncbi:serine hydroxymethyltransferase, partial [Lactiplantibacillus plantarum]|nr:serine hydroxymethyltransferase [Lactiplantibacillus plantarum]
AVALGEALRPEFKDYQAQVIKNAQAMAEVFENEPDLHVVTGGTDNHLMTVDLTQTGHNGKEIQDLLDTVYITLNKEAIPDEKLSPFKTSGIRIGTPAVTTRGFNEADSRKVAELIIRAIHHVDEPE